MMRASLILIFFVAGSLRVISQDSVAHSFFYPDSIRYLVEVLASDSLEGRFTGTPGNTKAANFIASKFQQAGLIPVAGNEGYFMPAGKLGYNVVGGLQGRTKPGQLIIFSAHYDHVGNTRTNPLGNRDIGSGRKKKKGRDDIFNGANDNASGVAALISLASYFSRAGNNNRTVLFIAFTGEELGLKGSSLAADRFAADSVIALINIEMIGRPYLQGDQPYITGRRFSNLPDLLNRELARTDPAKYGTDFFARDPFYGERLFERSDNYPFALKGVPAHSIMVSSPRDKYYHNRFDEADTLDYDLMNKIITAIATSSYGLISGVSTPYRVRL